MDQAGRFGENLEAFLSRSAPCEVARVLGALAQAALGVANIVRRGGLGGRLDAEVGPGHDGVAKKALDALADDAFIDRLKGAGVRGVVSEERDEPVALDASGALLVAIDPLDGSSNIEVNGAIGTLFSVLDTPDEAFNASLFLQPGRRQRAAGLAFYGSRADFVFTTGRGVHVATLDPDAGLFRMSAFNLQIREGAREFAINASNSRHWPAPVRAYVEDCLEGDQGPRGRNFNMRWVGAVVGDVYRILMRGGVYLYPEDSREGYEHGRLRLLYEANPIALLIEQAGGAAIDGFQRILDITPASIHARTPLIFGSKDKVDRIALYYRDGRGAQRAPLFQKRSLLRR